MFDDEEGPGGSGSEGSEGPDLLYSEEEGSQGEDEGSEGWSEEEGEKRGRAGQAGEQDEEEDELAMFGEVGVSCWLLLINSWSRAAALELLAMATDAHCRLLEPAARLPDFCCLHSGGGDEALHCGPGACPECS